MYFIETNPKDNPGAKELLEELSMFLMQITGASGQNSFLLKIWRKFVPVLYWQ
jgi:hypothetical protein